MGIVNSTYKSFQNTNVFSFLDSIVQQGDASFYSAGYIGKGEKVWLLLKLIDNISLSVNDTIQEFILFSNAHDGRGSIRAYFFPIHLETQNVLNISFGKRVEQGIQMRHVGKVKERIEEVRKIFGLANIFYKRFEETSKMLYVYRLNKSDVDLFLSSCFDTYSLESTRTKNTLEKIKTIYKKESKRNHFSENSAWLWFNSVVYFIDHERESKGKTIFERKSNHIESLLWGSALLLKIKAWNTILSLAKI